MSDQSDSDLRLLTVKEVQERLKVCHVTVHRLIRRGAIQTAKLGRSRRVLASSLDDYIRRNLRGGEA
jgi:excisionase family DNA binding protein